MYIHGFMYRHSMTYYTSLLLFHFNNRQSQVEVNIYICAFLCAPFMVKFLVLQNVWCLLWQLPKKLYILIHALCMWLIEIDWSHATLRSPVKHLQLHKQGGNFPCNLIWSLLPHHLRKSGHAMRSDALYAGVSKHAGPKPGMLVCWSIISATQPFRWMSPDTIARTSPGCRMRAAIHSQLQARNKKVDL